MAQHGGYCFGLLASAGYRITRLPGIMPGMANIPTTHSGTSANTSGALNLLDLLRSWELALKAERKAVGTIKTYQDGVRAYLRWAGGETSPPGISRASAQAWVAGLLDSGAEPSTVHARLKGLRRFTVWLVEENELPSDPLAGMRSPKLDTKLVNALSDDQLRRLLKACSGNRLVDRRDEAILRLMIDTGARAGEVVALQTADVDLDHQRVKITRGKGGKGRVVPISSQTVLAIDRYLRVRRRERLTDAGPLWVAARRGKTFGYSGLRDALGARAREAGVRGFHLHLLRHTFATRWKAARGSDDGLMSIAGWSSRAMVDRYSGAAAAERAAAEAERLGLGDL